MEVYSIEHDIENLILLDGLDVINGAYRCKRNKDGSLSIPGSELKAYLVKTLSKSATRGNYDVTKILIAVEKELKRKERKGCVS